MDNIKRRSQSQWPYARANDGVNSVDCFRSKPLLLIVSDYS
jgi:hypothetical protein